MSNRGAWINKDGIWLRPHGWVDGSRWFLIGPHRRRRQWLYKLDDLSPSTYHAAGDYYVRASSAGKTDMGSVPEQLQPIVAKDGHLPAFLIHDDICQFRAAWVSRGYCGPYVRGPVSSDECHALLREMILADGEQFPGEADLICNVVLEFGPRW